MLNFSLMAKTIEDWIDSFSEWPVAVGLVALKEGCTDRTVRKWAEVNNVRVIGGGKRSQYLFFKGDVVNFRKRDRPGRRWSK